MLPLETSPIAETGATATSVAPRAGRTGAAYPGGDGKGGADASSAGHYRATSRTRPTFGPVALLPGPTGTLRGGCPPAWPGRRLDRLHAGQLSSKTARRPGAEWIRDQIACLQQLQGSFLRAVEMSQACEDIAAVTGCQLRGGLSGLSFDNWLASRTKPLYMGTSVPGGRRQISLAYLFLEHGNVLHTLWR
jgi:hypothetical protein